MTVAKLDLRNIDFDLDGFLNAGGLLQTYSAGTTTPLATYTDATGATPNANPIVMDSSGGYHLWITTGVSYKFVFKTAGGVVIYTEDAVMVGDPSGADGGGGGDTPTGWEDSFYFLGGPPTVGQEMYRYPFTRAVVVAANWSGSYGSVLANPAVSFVAACAKNGSACGTITISTAGAFAFATSGGATLSFTPGDVLTVTGPDPVVSSILGIAVNFAGNLA